ncbi:hypothetical protein EON64_06500 [archaeon]|nr:MAG: hypothetical protein EON64_06500 [archaeon]
MGGIFSTKEFVRNDKVVGQGKEVLVFCKAVHVSKYELNRLFHVFDQHADRKTHVIAMSLFFKEFKVQYTLFASILFQFFDIHKTGELSFYEFLVIFWVLLSTDEDSLAVLCFSIFDLSKSNVLDLDEVHYLVQMVWQFDPPKAAAKALKKLQQNRDGTVTLPEFVLLSKHHPQLLSPVRPLKTEWRTHIVFPRFWRQLQRRRAAQFGSPSNGLLLTGRVEQRDYTQASMDYLNLRSDLVPRQFSEQHRALQRKKRSGGGGRVACWPYELLEHYQACTQPAAPDDFAQQEGYETRSVSGQAHSERHQAEVPRAIQEALNAPSKSTRPSSIYTPSQQQLADMHYII